jgi:hypothetical protein
LIQINGNGAALCRFFDPLQAAGLGGVTRSNARSWQGRNPYPWRITTDAPTIVNLRQDLGGAISGGVITYTANGAQKVAVAAGFTMLAWPTKIVKAKIVVLGLDSASAIQ